MHVFNGILNRNDVVSRLLVEQANERCERARLAVARWTGEDYEAFLVLRHCRKRLRKSQGCKGWDFGSDEPKGCLEASTLPTHVYAESADRELLEGKIAGTIHGKHSG